MWHWLPLEATLAKQAKEKGKASSSSFT